MVVQSDARKVAHRILKYEYFVSYTSSQRVKLKSFLLK